MLKRSRNAEIVQKQSDLWPPRHLTSTEDLGARPRAAACSRGPSLLPAPARALAPVAALTLVQTLEREPVPAVTAVQSLGDAAHRGR